MCVLLFLIASVDSDIICIFVIASFGCLVGTSTHLMWAFFYLFRLGGVQGFINFEKKKKKFLNPSYRAGSHPSGGVQEKKSLNPSYRAGSQTIRRGSRKKILEPLLLYRVPIDQEGFNDLCGGGDKEVAKSIRRGSRIYQLLVEKCFFATKATYMGYDHIYSAKVQKSSGGVQGKFSQKKFLNPSYRAGSQSIRRGSRKKIS